jgi:hypothetical protein
MNRNGHFEGGGGGGMVSVEVVESESVSVSLRFLCFLLEVTVPSLERRLDRLLEESFSFFEDVMMDNVKSDHRKNVE